MVEYKEKKNENRSTYYKVYQNGTEKRIPKDEYLKKVKKVKKGGEPVNDFFYYLIDKANANSDVNSNDLIKNYGSFKSSDIQSVIDQWPRVCKEEVTQEGHGTINCNNIMITLKSFLNFLKQKEYNNRFN